MASILRIKRNKGYTYRAYIRKTGLKPISKVFSTRRLAEDFIKRVEGDKELLLAYGGAKDYQITLNVMIDEYMKYGYLGKDAQKQASRVQFWSDRYGHKLLSDITRADISRGVFELSNTLSNATVNRHKSALSVVFAFACRQYELPDNPALHIPSLTEDNSCIRFLSSEERKRLFEACKGSSWDKLHLLVLMAITTGARKGELTSLCWNDIDFGRQTAFVKTSKNGEPKVLPLTDSVIKELLIYKEDNGLLFPSRLIPNKPFCFTKPWYRALEDAQIKDFRFHDLRHSCASYLAQSGASLLEIADVLGHKQIQVTKRYTHLCIEHKSSLIHRVMGGI
jgi:integrase